MLGVVCIFSFCECIFIEKILHLMERYNNSEQKMQLCDLIKIILRLLC